MPLVPEDDVSGGCDGLVVAGAGDDDVLDDDDPPGLVLALDEDEAADVRAGVAVVHGELLEAVGPALAWDAGVVVGLAVCVGFGEVVGLGVTLGLGLALEVAVALGLVLVLTLVLALLLVLPVLLLAEALVLLPAAVVAGLACATALDELAGDDEHDETAAGLLAWPGAVLASEPVPSPRPPPAGLG